MTEAARREGGAARGPAPAPTAEEEEEEEGAPLDVKEWGIVVKEVLRGLDARRKEGRNALPPVGVERREK